jgi:ATP-binding cassette ChvD family protein
MSEDGCRSSTCRGFASSRTAASGLGHSRQIPPNPAKHSDIPAGAGMLADNITGGGTRRHLAVTAANGPYLTSCRVGLEVGMHKKLSRPKGFTRHGGRAAGWLCRIDRAEVVRHDRVVLQDVSLRVGPRTTIGVVGPSGAGKSTLLNLMAGTVQPCAGSALWATDSAVSLLPQDVALDDATTVRAHIEDSVAPVKTLLERFDQLSKQVAADPHHRALNELRELQTAVEDARCWDVDARIDAVMHALRCPPGDAPAASLSEGERRRAALCMALLQPSNLLLLDEPTNHLDAESAAWLEHYLRTYPGSIVVATHDRYLLENIADEIVEVDRGRVETYQGNYSAYLQAKLDRLPVVGRKDAQERGRLLAELQTARTSPQARQVASRSRLSRYPQMATAERARREDFDEIRIPPGPRLAEVVAVAQEVAKGFGGVPLIRDLSFSVPRNGIVGVIGPSGAGKTTLLRMIAGLERPDSGVLQIGDTVRISYVDHTRSGINPAATAWDLVSDSQTFIALFDAEIATRAYLEAFGFRDDQEKPVAQFSGSELSRLYLALTLRQGGNVVLLDEPTKHLDIDTIATLERALLEFPGCVLLTTHDRWLLDRVATHILAWEGTETDPAQWYWFEGNFAGYTQNKRDRLGAGAAGRHRLAHHNLVRD